MDSYTFGQVPPEVIEAKLPDKYAMELNRTDMTHLIEALLIAWNQEDQPRASEWAGEFRSSILSTIGIEEI